MHRGVCVSGPMAGQTITTRSEVGLVAVDAAGSAAWVYRIDRATGRYVLDLQQDPSSLDELGTRALDQDRVRAAADQGFDVIALPGEDDEPPAPPPVIDDSCDDEECAD